MILDLVLPDEKNYTQFALGAALPAFCETQDVLDPLQLVI